MRRSARQVTVAVAAVAAVAAVVGLIATAGPGRSVLESQAETGRGGAQDPAPRSDRAFTADSWWNTPVPEDAPRHPRAREVLTYLTTAREGSDCVMLAGAGESPWGQPVYWATAQDREYDVQMRTSLAQPPELESLRLPRNAEAAPTSDAAMTIFDVDRGYVVALTGARFDAADDSWTTAGATVTYLASNGLDVRTNRSDDERNRGTHRGNNGATMMVRYDQVQDGVIDHVLKVASGPETSRRAVFPMVGSDGSSRDENAPPQGLRFRIKPDVDLDDLGLDGEALVIARALQTYGFYLGDSGNTTALKLENTRAEGRDQLWTLPADALCAIPLDPEFWDVLPEGYYPGE